MSCTYRLQKAIQRLDGVERVKVRLDPAGAEVTPRAGVWLEPERLRDAIRQAGFKPGEIRCTISGPLVEWHGQPAVSLGDGQRLVVLMASPDAPGAFAKARRMLAAAEKGVVEVEGLFAGRAGTGDPASPVALRAGRVAAAR